MSKMINTIKSLAEEYELLDNEEVIIMPYESFNLTQPDEKNEVALTLNDIIVACTIKKDESGKIIDQMSQIYSKNGVKIGETVESGQIKCELEIISSLIESQQKKLDELTGNFTVAGASTLDDQGRIESYIELVNREIVTMNKRQKEEYDKLKTEYERDTDTFDDKDIESKRSKKEELDRNVENINIIKNKEDAETVKELAEQDLGFGIQNIVPIEDSLFYENNPSVVNGKAFFSVDTKGKPQIIYSNNGKFEKSDGFQESQNKSSRLPIMTADDKYIQEKNVYGSIKSTRNDIGYAFAYGDYGVPELIEVRPNKNGGLEEVEKGIGRKVTLYNTSYNDINREGNTKNNITRETFRVENGYSTDGHPTEGVSKKVQQINDDRAQDGNIEDITPEDLANNVDLRIQNAYVRIEQKLKQDGVNLTSNDEQEIRLNIKDKIENDNMLFDDEGVDTYCDEYKKTQEIKEDEREDVEEEQEPPTLYNTHKRPWM